MTPNPKRRAVTVDRHSLYEASVQSVEADANFLERIWRTRYGGRPHLLREDFCGSASLAAHWVTRHRDHRSWGVDLDRPTLEWGRRHRVAPLGERASRVTLVQADVRSPAEVAVDVEAAFNFSYFIFHRRPEMLGYFRAAYANLESPGLFCLDLFGGNDSMCTLEEDRQVAASEDPDGRRVPAFTYTWHQASFNAIDHRITCHIHFRLRGQKRKRAFTYHWRMWTLPEIQDLLEEAGFSSSDVYVEGWDDEADDTDGVSRRRTELDNDGGWIAYVAAWKDPIP